MNYGLTSLRSAQAASTSWPVISLRPSVLVASGNFKSFICLCIVMFRLRCENFTSTNFLGLSERCQYLQAKFSPLQNDGFYWKQDWKWISVLTASQGFYRQKCQKCQKLTEMTEIDKNDRNDQNDRIDQNDRNDKKDKSWRQPKTTSNWLLNRITERHARGQ